MKTAARMLKNDVFHMRLTSADTALLDEISKQTGLTKANVILVAVRQFGDVQKLSKQLKAITEKFSETLEKSLKAHINEIAALRLLNKILRALPHDYENTKIDEAFEIYYQETGKLKPKVLQEKGVPIFDLPEIGMS